MGRAINPNFSAFSVTLSALFRNPSMLMPHLIIPTFLELPEDLGSHLASSCGVEKRPDIRALVLDKDNTLAPPEALSFPSSYLEKLETLRKSPTSPFNMEKNPYGVLVVSNTVGSSPKYEAEAREIESLLSHLKIPVLRSFSHASSEEHAVLHDNKKPLNHSKILAHFKSHDVVESPAQIAIVGDRLATDVLMASMMGAWSVWIKDGVTQSCEGRQGMDYRGFLAKTEAVLEGLLRKRGFGPVLPKGWN
ncbi:hypothetical protein KEM55_002524 [Ascosphaera atra]|nr:hypothetical protein KEM55_002524 [Ascosphaera atra]